MHKIVKITKTAKHYYWKIYSNFSI